MITTLDALLLLLIFLTYGVGDVVTTLYGMKYRGMKEGNRYMVYLFGDTFHWYESILAKSMTLILVLILYYVTRVWYSSLMYQIIWWFLSTIITIQGIKVSILNLKDIKYS